MRIDRFKPYSLRNMRSKPERQVESGFTATLNRGEAAVATIDAGSTEDPSYLGVEFTYDAEREAFETFAAATISEEDRKLAGYLDVPDPMSHAELLDPDEAMIRLLAEATYHDLRLSRMCADNTLYQLPGDDPDTWHQVEAPYRSALATAIRRKHPEAAILNEQLAAQSV